MPMEKIKNHNKNAQFHGQNKSDKKQHYCYNLQNTTQETED